MKNEYWGKRLADRAYMHNTAKTLKILRKIYQDQAKEIQYKITELYVNMLEEGGITTTNLYAYGRFTELIREINQILREYGGQEVAIVSGGLEEAYKEAFGKTSRELEMCIRDSLYSVLPLGCFLYSCQHYNYCHSDTVFPFL